LGIHTYKIRIDHEQGLRCRATARGFELVMDEPKSLGGTDSGMTPLEALLSSLGGCIAITAKAHSRKVGVKLESCSVSVEGDLDPAGFMLKSDEVRSGFQQIRVALSVQADASDEQLQELIELVERACPVSDSLRGVEIEARAERA